MKEVKQRIHLITYQIIKVDNYKLIKVHLTINNLIDNNNKDLTQFMNKVLLEYLKIYKVIQI